MDNLVLASVVRELTRDWSGGVLEELRQEAGYAAMDFVTRDRYRHAIEDLARGSRVSELEVARRAMAQARAAAARTGEGSPESDPGHVLISRGRVDFEKALGFTLPLRRRLLRAFIGTATPQYVGTIAIVTESPLFFVGGGEVDAKPRKGFEVAVIQLEVDSIGLGTGTMAAAARVRPGGATGVQIDDYAETPVKLVTVRKSFASPQK